MKWTRMEELKEERARRRSRRRWRRWMGRQCKRKETKGISGLRDELCV